MNKQETDIYNYTLKRYMTVGEVKKSLFAQSKEYEAWLKSLIV